IAGAAARSCGVPAVCHVRADCPAQPYRWLLLSTLKKIVRGIAVPSRFTGSWIADASPELGGRIRRGYDSAFDADGYRPEMSGSKVREELGIADDVALVVLVSKLVPVKGHACFIRAAEKVHQSSQKIQFVIVGGAVPGHEAEAAETEKLAAT